MHDSSAASYHGIVERRETTCAAAVDVSSGGENGGDDCELVMIVSKESRTEACRALIHPSLCVARTEKICTNDGPQKKCQACAKTIGSHFGEQTSEGHKYEHLASPQPLRKFRLYMIPKI